MKKRLVSIIAGSMIIIMFAMNMEHIQNRPSDVNNNTKSNLSSFTITNITDNKKKDDILFNLPMMIPCADLKSVEEYLLKQGLRILATGVVGAEEIVEVWVGVEKKNFMLLKVHPTLGVSCFLVGGPILEPGGDYLDSTTQSPKKNPM